MYVDIDMTEEDQWLTCYAHFEGMSSIELGRIGRGFVENNKEIEGQWIALMKLVLKDQCEKIGITGIKFTGGVQN